MVRARSADEPRPTELILNNSRREGPQHLLATDRLYLARAVRLGFRQFSFSGQTRPALAKMPIDDTYGWD